MSSETLAVGIPPRRPFINVIAMLLDRCLLDPTPSSSRLMQDYSSTRIICPVYILLWVAACGDDTAAVDSNAATSTDNDGDPGDGDGDGDPGDGDGDGGPECGNGVVEDGEVCDDGNTNNNDQCLDTCEEASCGDGYVGPGEGCDDGNDNDDDECSNACALASCGDGRLDVGEACDDGNDDDSDACTSQCTDATCGDGFVWAGVEECDDADLDEGDGCSPICTVEPNPPNNWIYRTNLWGDISHVRFRTIANFADDDIWFLGNVAVHFDGTWLTGYEVPFGDSLVMLDSATSPEGEIWATEGDHLYYYDGSGWATIQGVPYGVFAVWRSPEGVIWLGAEDGLFLRSTDSGWEDVPGPVNEDISSLWGAQDTDIWATTTGGSILRWNGTQWALADQGNGGFVRIRGSTADNVIAISPNSYSREWDGQSWSNVGLGLGNYFDIYWLDSGRPCATGGHQNFGRMTCLDDSDQWVPILPDDTEDWIDTMTELDDGRRVVADEQGGLVALEPDSGWTATTPLSDQHSMMIHGAWHRADDDIWAVSWEDIVHYDGNDWAVTQTTSQGGWGKMDGFGNTGWIARDPGVMWRFDGGAWVEENVPVATKTIEWIEIHAENEGWAMGTNGLLLRLHGGVWLDASVPNMSPKDVYALGDDDVYLVAAPASLLHWDGMSWTPLAAPPVDDGMTFLRIDGTDANNIWIVGDDDTILQWDGVEWTEHDLSINPFYPADFSVLDVEPDGVWVRSPISDDIHRYRDGAWTELVLPFSDQVQATFRASDTSRWFLGNRIVEVRDWE